MSSPATIIIENFPIYHFEAKSRLNKDLHALFMKSGGFSLQGCIKGKFMFLTKQTCTTRMYTGVYQLH